MNYEAIKDKYNWIEYSGQLDKDVTYIFVNNQPIKRFFGTSNILYIGKTGQTIADRYKQETNTNNTPKNSQLTNIRMTHIFKEIGIQNVRCYYIKNKIIKVPDKEVSEFLNKCHTWAKKLWIRHYENKKRSGIEVDLEKYLLVSYAAEHMETPPMNNRM